MTRNLTPYGQASIVMEGVTMLKATTDTMARGLLVAEPQLDGMATPVEAATFLRISKSMVHKLIGENKMPSCRYGRVIRVPWRWLQAQAAVDKDPAASKRQNEGL
jgi:excisionase family DNA binding protein